MCFRLNLSEQLIWHVKYNNNTKQKVLHKSEKIKSKKNKTSKKDFEICDLEEKQGLSKHNDSSDLQD